ncbi:sensor histidine kinase [Eisenbergiella sp.]|uniref:sensor histidine kinase n=1 Tax=Eisenbergiella sp. TaxID=1924109 RepID=UPI0020812FAB|nr:histidine kinase [Eisenbergiella sp.]BDF47831.1 two-component sensor histidine kinase [Lachnospiraceae bacterium]GKH43906.1 two-component sensor histidine kinase [Lachnospiraceae bacterium]
MIRKIKRKYTDQTLHQKVRFSILLFSLLPLVCLACISLPLIYKNQIGKLKEEVYDELQNKADDMNYEMNTIELMAKTVWSDTTFITEVGKAAIDGSLGEYNRYLFQEQTLSVLKVITSISQVQSARIHLEYPGLREYFSYLYSMDRARDSLWYQDRNSLTYNGAWYLNVTDKQSAGTYSNYFTEKNMASFVIPVRISSELTGIFEIVLPMKAIVPELYTTMKTSDIFLVDSQNRLLGVEASGKFGEITVEKLADMMGLSSLNDFDLQGIQLYQGLWKHSPVILSVSKNEKNGIFLMQLTSVRKQYQTMLLQIIIILLTEIMMTALLLQAVNSIVKRLLHDFDVFSECMREVENGNLDVEIPRLEQVEINAVAMEYNRMLGRVKQLMEISIHREVMVKEAQLKSLEKQINSHFLYNVLDSIKMMAEVRGIYNVSDALLALARMFRYNLQIDSHSVTLQEEIAYLENYLKLCNIRYDYYINLSENVEDPAGKLKVPKVILQPIAENSIAHGLDELAEDTTIYLKVYRKGDCAYIEMTDMGKGMDEDKLRKVREVIQNGGGGDNSTNGIGLHNIHERIRLMYGEEYGVEIFSMENCYTKVVLTIHAEVTA